MNDKFETMPSQELLAYVFKDNSPKRFIDVIVPYKNINGRCRAFHDTKTGQVFTRNHLVDQAITMRMLEICEVEREVIQSNINNQVGDYQDLIDQLAIYDNLIDEVNNNAMKILAKYGNFENFRKGDSKQ